MGNSISITEAAYYDNDKKHVVTIDKIVHKYSFYQNVQLRCNGCGLALKLAKKGTGTVYLFSQRNVDHEEGCIFDDSTISKIKKMDKRLKEGDLRVDFSGLMQTDSIPSSASELKSGISFEDLHAPIGNKKSSRVVVNSAKGIANLLTFDKETNEKVRKYLVSKNLYFYTSNLIEKLFELTNSHKVPAPIIIDGILDVETKNKLVLLSPSFDRKSLFDIHVNFAPHREKALESELESIRATKTYPGNRIIVIGKVINSFVDEEKKVIEVEALDLAWRKSKLTN